MSAEFSCEGCGRPTAQASGYSTPVAHLCEGCYDAREHACEGPPDGWHDMGNGRCYLTIPEYAISYRRAWDAEQERRSPRLLRSTRECANDYTAALLKIQKIAAAMRLSTTHRDTYDVSDIDIWADEIDAAIAQARR